MSPPPIQKPNRGRLVTITPQGRTIPRSRSAAFVWHGFADSHEEARGLAYACFQMAWAAMNGARGNSGAPMPEKWEAFKLQPEYAGGFRESWSIGKPMLDNLPPAGTVESEDKLAPARIMASQRSIRYALPLGGTATLKVESVKPVATNRDRFWAKLIHPAATLTAASERTLLALCAAEVGVLGHRKFQSLDTVTAKLPASATLSLAQRVESGLHAPRLLAPLVAQLRRWGIDELAGDLEAQGARDAAQAMGEAA